MTKVGNFNTLEIHIIAQNVATLELSRGAKSNAVNSEMWDELPPVCPILSRSCSETPQLYSIC